LNKPTARIVFVLFILALVLRLWGIWFGLPGFDHGDETEVVNHALRFGSGDLNPHRFQYGSFFQYILFFVYGLYFAAGYLAGQFPTVQSFALAFIQDPSAFYLIARSLSAFFGALTVVLVFFIGKRLRDMSVGVGAALLLGVCYEHAVHAHYATVDVFLTCLFTFALYRCALVIDTPTYRNMLIAGFAAGLCMGAKFNGVFAVVAVVLSMILSRSERSTLKTIFPLRSVTVMCMTLLGHFLVSPFFYIDFPVAFEEIRQLRAMHASESFTLVRYFAGLLGGYFGIPAGILCLAGFCRLLVSRDRRVWVLLVTTIAVLFFISLHAYADPRYMLQVFPVFAIAAAVVISELLAPVKSRVLFVLVWAAILINPLYRTVAWNVEHSGPSIPLQAKHWIEQNIPVNAKILVDNAGNKGPTLNNAPASLQAQYERAKQHNLLKAEYLALKLKIRPERYYRVYEIANPGGFREDDYLRYLSWQDTEEIGMAPAYYRSKGFEYIVVTKKLFSAMDQEGFVLLREFRAGKKAIRIYAVVDP
jgi:4-amino-4-deoxy-L-arabinose transferase-like glycosyltransferase